MNPRKVVPGGGGGNGGGADRGAKVGAAMASRSSAPSMDLRRRVGREWWLARCVGEEGEREQRPWQLGGQLPRRMLVAVPPRAEPRWASTSPEDHPNPNPSDFINAMYTCQLLSYGFRISVRPVCVDACIKIKIVKIIIYQDYWLCTFVHFLHFPLCTKLLVRKFSSWA
jgi:hypothetical protein